MEPKNDILKELIRESEARRLRGLVAPNVIPTKYKGIEFRSKLEARWAVFFDTLAIDWEYEPQGYRIGSSITADAKRYLMSDGSIQYRHSENEPGWLNLLNYLEQDKGLTILDELEPLGDLDPNIEWYLPDFWLPELKIWAEVKGKVGESELVTAVRAVDGFSNGLPYIHEMPNFRAGRTELTGLLYLGDIPNPQRNPQSGAHVLFGNRKGVNTYATRFRLNKETSRIELELGQDLGVWFDVTTLYDGKLDGYGNAEKWLAERVVKGLPRDYYSIEGIHPKLVRSHDAKDYWQKDKYPPVAEDLVGEHVIHFAWETARNYKF